MEDPYQRILPPTVDLLSMLKTNPDIFYETLSKLTNEDLRNLCNTNRSFYKLCNNDDFWEELWRHSFIKPIPKKDIKLNYEKENLLYSVSLILYNYENIKNDKRLKNIRYLLNEDIIKQRSLYFTIITDNIIDKSIKNRDIDVLLFIMIYLKEIDYLLEELIKNDDNVLVEKLLKNITNEDLINFIKRNKLSLLIQLPRSSNNCNEDLINLYFEYSKLDPFNMADSLEFAINSRCKNLIHILLQNLNDNASPNIIEYLVSHFTGNQEDEFKFVPLFRKYDRFSQEL